MYFARLKDNFCGNDPKIPWILWLKMTHWATDESECKNSWTKSNCIHLRSYKSKMEPVYNNSITEIADNTKTMKEWKSTEYSVILWKMLISSEALFFALDISYNDTVWEFERHIQIYFLVLCASLFERDHWRKKYWIFIDFCFCLLSKQKPSCLKQWSLYTLLELLNNADLVDKVTNDWQRLFLGCKIYQTYG